MQALGKSRGYLSEDLILYRHEFEGAVSAWTGGGVFDAIYSSLIFSMPLWVVWAYARHRIGEGDSRSKLPLLGPHLDPK